jgi:hypothetical protein
MSDPTNQSRVEMGSGWAWDGVNASSLTQTPQTTLQDRMQASGAMALVPSGAFGPEGRVKVARGILAEHLALTSEGRYFGPQAEHVREADKILVKMLMALLGADEYVQPLRRGLEAYQRVLEIPEDPGL